MGDMHELKFSFFFFQNMHEDIFLKIKYALVGVELVRRVT